MNPIRDIVPRRFRAAGLTVLLVATLVGCARDLAFRQDHSVEFVEPGSNEEVTLPLELSWDNSGHDGLFGVFFDRSPMRPGEALDSLVPDDDPCGPNPDCPDDEWLNDRYIFVTDATSLKVLLLPDRSESRDADPHEVTIVLLDRAGRRINEAAFVREFTIDRSR